MAPYVLDYSARLIGKIPSAVEIIDDAFPDLPNVSPYKAESKALTPAAGAFLDQAWGGASSRLAVIEEHLRVISDMMQRPQVIYSIYSLARPVVEMSGIARWLVEPMPNRTVESAGMERAKRAASDRRHSLRNLKNLDAPEAKANAVDRLQRLNAEAGRAGVGGVGRPKPTDFIGLALDAPKDTVLIGKTVQSLLSAHSHGTLFALVRLLRPADEAAPVEGIIRGRITSPATDEATIVQACALAYHNAAMPLMDYLGVDSSRWLASWLYATKALGDASTEAAEMVSHDRD